MSVGNPTLIYYMYVSELNNKLDYRFQSLRELALK